MKKKIIPFLLLLILSVFASCEKNLDVYKGECGIFFDTRNTYIDTLVVHWGQLDSDVKEMEWWLRVNLIGDTKDYDRHFQISVTTDEGDEYAAVEGVDYVKFPTDYVIKAGENEAYIYFTLLRDPNLAEKPKRFKVSLIPNDELKFIYTRYDGYFDAEGNLITREMDYQRLIEMDEEFPMPAWWGIYGDQYFGKWSAKKSILICDVLKISRTEWLKDTTQGLSAGYLKFAGKYMQQWLNEHPTLDEDGEPMTMGEASQG